MAFSAANRNNTITNPQGTLDKDITLENSPRGDISQIEFSPSSQQPILAASSWDGSVSLYDASKQTGSLLHKIELGSPALGIMWHPGGSGLYAYSASGTVHMIDLFSPNNLMTAVNAPTTIMTANYIQHNNENLIATGCKDQVMRFWDARQQTHIQSGELQLPGRPFLSDVKGNLMATALSDRKIAVVDLSDRNRIYKNMTVNLKYQLSSLTCFPDTLGFAAGSVEGRCAIQYIDEGSTGGRYNSTNQKTFSFKCHRVEKAGQPTDVYAVNDIAFHPILGTFATAGADGTFHFWDKDSRHRLRAFPSSNRSITSISFSPTGELFAYALSYDWSKGAAGYDPNTPSVIKVHPTPNSAGELQPRSK